MSRILVSRVFVNLMKFVSCTLGKSLGEHETISGLFLEFSGIGRWSNKKATQQFPLGPVNWVIVNHHNSGKVICLGLFQKIPI